MQCLTLIDLLKEVDCKEGLTERDKGVEFQAMERFSGIGDKNSRLICRGQGVVVYADQTW